MVGRGFERCKPVQRVLSELGVVLPDVPVLMRFGNEKVNPASRFLINGDGTVQSGFERHRGQVLGVDADNRVCWTNHSDCARRLHLRVDAGGVPVTGLELSKQPSTPLRLDGHHAGSAIVMAGLVDWGVGFEQTNLTTGPVEEALCVHFSNSSRIHSADQPMRAFYSVESAMTVGSRVVLFHAHMGERELFQVNEDGTVSPLARADLVWEFSANMLRLAVRDDNNPKQVFLDESVVAAARSVASVDSQSNVLNREPLIENVGTRVLALESHPGCALSLEPDPVTLGTFRFVIAPLADAQEFRVEADHLRLASTGEVLLLGAPNE